MNPREIRQQIIELVARLLRDGKNGEEPAVFRSEAAATINAHLAKLFEADLVPAAEQLVLLAYHLETEHRSPSAAKLIAEILENTDFNARLMRGAETVGDRALEASIGRQANNAEHKAVLFNSLTATRVAKTAPRLGADAPKDSVKLSSFLQPGAPHGRPVRSPQSTPPRARRGVAVR
jgi:hypothetical protein